MELFLKYQIQIKRIQEKLKKAKSADRRFQVFGAKEHKYYLGRPLSTETLASFEKKFQIALPEPFKAFLLYIGDGGKSKYGNAGAGPNYGIFPLGLCVDEQTEDVIQHLNTPSLLHPKMSDNEWQALESKLLEDYTDSTNYDAEERKILSGLICIGHQGCGLHQYLAISGPFKGRIINMDTDPVSKPIFAHESNFLDWYERWLDEIIDGRLIDEKACAFGYVKGGSANSLLAFYDEAEDDFDKRDALEGFSNLQSVSLENCNRLINIIESETRTVKHKAIEALCRWQYNSAKPYLKALISGSDEEALIAFKMIFYNARDKAPQWAEFIRDQLKHIKTYDTLRFASYILDETTIDYVEEIIPFCQNENVKIRVLAYYCLGKSPIKHHYISQFTLGLRDTSQSVVHRCLQSLEGVQDTRLIEPYYFSRKQFQLDEYSLEINLEHRVRDMGFHSVTDFYKSYKNGTAEVRMESVRGKINTFINKL